MKSILFQLLLRFMCSGSRLYFVSVLQNISVSLNENMSISVPVSISVNEYNTDDYMVPESEMFIFRLGLRKAGSRWSTDP